MSKKDPTLIDAFEAVDNNDLPALIRLNHFDVNAFDFEYESKTMLYIAAENGLCEMVAFLLYCGANPLQKHPKHNNMTPLDQVLKMSNSTFKKTDQTHFIRTLLDVTINVNRPLGSFLYPEMDSRDASEKILNEVDIPDWQRRVFYNLLQHTTPLYYAVSRSMAYSVRYLLEMRGANPNIGMLERTGSGTALTTPLSLALSLHDRENGAYMEEEIVRTLIAHGADVLIAERQAQTNQAVRNELVRQYLLSQSVGCGLKKRPREYDRLTDGPQFSGL
jgi:hypothetical protein